jgi:hypothetical protein
LGGGGSEEEEEEEKEKEAVLILKNPKFQNMTSVFEQSFKYKLLMEKYFQLLV